MPAIPAMLLAPLLAGTPPPHVEACFTAAEAVYRGGRYTDAARAYADAAEHPACAAHAGLLLANSATALEKTLSGEPSRAHCAVAERFARARARLERGPVAGHTEQRARHHDAQCRLAAAMYAARPAASEAPAPAAPPAYEALLPSAPPPAVLYTSGSIAPAPSRPYALAASIVGGLGAVGTAYAFALAHGAESDRGAARRDYLEAEVGSALERDALARFEEANGEVERYGRAFHALAAGTGLVVTAAVTLWFLEGEPAPSTGALAGGTD